MKGSAKRVMVVMKMHTVYGLDGETRSGYMRNLGDLIVDCSVPNTILMVQNHMYHDARQLSVSCIHRRFLLQTALNPF